MRIIKIIVPLFLTLMIMFTFVTCWDSGSIPTNPPDGNGDGDDNGNGTPTTNDPPQALMSLNPTLRAYSQGDTINFDGSASTDPDGSIVEYEWDFNYDDNVFKIGDVGPRIDYALPSFGSVIAALRVVDSGDPSKTSIARKRLNVKPSGQLSNITKGKVDNFLLRRAVESNGDFYVLYTGTIFSTYGAWIQRSSDGGASWGEPVPVSERLGDESHLGIWMDSAPWGVVIGWITKTGALKHAAAVPYVIDLVTVDEPQVLANLSVTIMNEPVLYSIACTDDGKYSYMAYRSNGKSDVMLVINTLDSSGKPTDTQTIKAFTDNDDRKDITGMSVTAAPSGRCYLAYIWKSLGYDNDDQLLLYYYDPPTFTQNGPVRVDVDMTGFIYNHDIYVTANNESEPIVYLRTTGIFQGGRDIGFCIGEGDPPVFKESIRANNTIGGDPLAAQNSPSAIFDRAHGHLWFAFEDFRDSVNRSQIYLTMFDKHYSAILPDFDISDDPSLIYSDINPHICFSGGANPSLVVVWERDGTDIVAYHASY